MTLMIYRWINEILAIMFFWKIPPRIRPFYRVSPGRLISLLVLLLVLVNGCGEPLWDSETAEVYGLSYKYLDNVVKEVSPPDAAGSVNPSASIYFTFNHSMDKGSVEENFSITPAAAGSFHWTDRFHLQFRPGSDLAYDTTYTIKIMSQASNVHDQVMKATFSSTFSTPTGAPVVFSVSPVDAATAVSPSSDIRVMFNEPVDRQSATLAFSLSPAVDGVFSWVDDDRTLVFTPDNKLARGITYTIGLTTAVKDLLDNHLAAAFSSSFTTLEPYETERPTILSIATLDEITIHILFSETLDKVSAEMLRNYTITGLGIREASLLEDEKTVAMVTFIQGEGISYAMEINNIMDKAGNLITPNTKVSFTGIHPPNLLAAYPESTVRVRLAFTEKLDTETAIDASNFSLSPTASIIRSEVLTSETEVRLSTTTLSSGQEYTVRVENVKDVDGNSIRQNNTTSFVGL